MKKISLSGIKNEIKKSGTSKGKFLYFKEDTKIRIRFLTDMEDGLEVPFHDSFKLSVNVPCQEIFGRDCSYCEDDELRTRNMYVWSVYDYESKEVKLLMFAVNQCSPVGAFASLYESYGTLTDRDYEVRQVGSGQSKSFSVIPLDKKRFRNEKVKALSEQTILKLIDKAYPSDTVDDEYEEDEEPKKRKQTKPNNKTNTKKKPKEVEEDWDDEEENENDYDSMSAIQLFKLCKERGLECKPKKSKEYYIDILEESDEEESDGDWDDEEEDWDDED